MTGGVPSQKDEFPPLLVPSMHILRLEELRRLCVEGFPLSSTRDRLMTNFEQAVSMIRSCGLKCDVWVNGSFLTAKIDPEDVDFSVCSVGNALTPNQERAIRWLVTEGYTALRCDAYYFALYPQGHPDYDKGMERYTYWQETWGYAVGSREPKGIAVVRVLGGVA